MDLAGIERTLMAAEAAYSQALRDEAKKAFASLRAGILAGRVTPAGLVAPLKSYPPGLRARLTEILHGVRAFGRESVRKELAAQG